MTLNLEHPRAFGVTSIRRVGVLFALPEEATPFLRQRGSMGEIQDIYKFPYCSQQHIQCGLATVLCSGVGMANACEAVHYLERLRKLYQSHGIPDPVVALVICGFAGGLAAELKPGMLVIGEDVTNSANEIIKADSRLLAVAESVRLPEVYAMRGVIYTGNKVLGKAVEKQELAGRSEAIAVDMETAGAAQVAEEYGIPWLAVRVITDGVNDDMPLDFNALADADGNVDKKRVIAATLTHPWKIPGLIRLGTRSQQAAKNLALFLEAFLRALPDTNL